MPIPCDCGDFFWDNRTCQGPTGSKDFSIIVFQCSSCGSMQPVFPLRLGWKELDWIKRWNRRAVRWYKDRQKIVDDPRPYCTDPNWNKRMSPTER